MQRLFLVLAVAVSTAGFGCSGKYEQRMKATFDQRKYELTLDQNLEPAPTDGPFRSNNVYVRAPKPMKLSGEAPPGIGPGAFDLEKSFNDGAKSSLVVLARVKKAAAATGKGAGKNAPPARRPFNEEVFSFVRSNCADDENLAPEKLKDDPKKDNAFKRVTTRTANGKSVEVYVLKTGTEDVALIFQSETADKDEARKKIDFALETFAIGPKALAKFGGNESGAPAEGGGGSSF